jgi:L-seryl-tRNA(Ser) seleniumtransferase
MMETTACLNLKLAKEKMGNNFRNLPSVNKLLDDERVKQLQKTYPHSVVVDLARQYLGNIRLSINEGNSCPSLAEMAESICERLQSLEQSNIRRVINATGVILHTNLGRALLSHDAVEAMKMAAENYTNLEFDLETGERGSRHVHAESLLCQLTGAESALVVNNNASAVLLTLTSLASGKEVIVSRGQAVEIGGKFRIPEVMKQSGAKLVEVGTTNCTYLSDYEQAITPETGALLRVHTSNFKVVGFTHSVALESLVELGSRMGIPVFDDLGSGCFLDTTEFGLAPEPTVQESISAGVALACFSGDKLLGGPQAGIIVGKKDFVDKLKKHPLSRAMRIDKIRLAGLVVTLLHYLKGEALDKIPTWRMISTPLNEIERRARECRDLINQISPLNGLVTIVQGESVVGGGSLPGSTLPTMLIAIKQGEGQGRAQNLARRLRCHRPPVVCRIEKDTLLFDPRTVLLEQDNALLRALKDTALS